MIAAAAFIVGVLVGIIGSAAVGFALQFDPATDAYNADTAPDPDWRKL